MTVIHCDFSQDWRGGQQQLLLLARALRARGWAQSIVTPSGTLAERWRREGFAALPPGWHAAAAARRAAIGHAHDGRALGWLMLVTAGSSRPARVASRRVAFPLRRLGAAKFRRAHRVLAVSGFVRAQLLAAGLHPERVTVVPDGFDPAELPDPATARAAVRAALRIPAQARLVACISALSAEKGVADLVAALPLLDFDILALLGGEGARQKELMGQAERIGVANRLIWAGPGPYGPGADASFSVPELIAAADLFVLPSREEGLGSSLLLALALERPIVATFAGGIPEIVEHERTGLLAPPGDPRRLATAIRRMFADPELRQRLVAAGASRLHERFSLTPILSATEAAYRQAWKEMRAK